MFIREVVKRNKGYKRRFIFHQLVESYRTDQGPRQRIILHMGRIQLSKEKWKDLANRIEEILLHLTIGSEHVSLSELRRLRINQILKESGLKEAQIKIAELLIVGRMVYPASEWRTYR